MELLLLLLLWRFGGFWFVFVGCHTVICGVRCISWRRNLRGCHWQYRLASLSGTILGGDAFCRYHCRYWNKRGIRILVGILVRFWSDGPHVGHLRRKGQEVSDVFHKGGWMTRRCLDGRFVLPGRTDEPRRGLRGSSPACSGTVWGGLLFVLLLLLVSLLLCWSVRRAVVVSKEIQRGYSVPVGNGGTLWMGHDQQREEAIGTN